MNWKMTKWQRGIVVSMALLASRYNEPETICFTRAALEFLMWFDWQGSHTKRMDELKERKWVTQDTDGHGLIIYRLTNAAYNCIVSDVVEAKKRLSYMPDQDQLL